MATLYREDGKVMKGPNYFKPNFFKILESSICDKAISR
jgi:hypothetical protein